MTSYAVPSPLLSTPGAVVAEGADAGVAAHYGDPMREQRLLAEGLAVVDLSHRGVVTVTGPDRLSWLHSMTTQHSPVSRRASARVARLSPKGHIEHALHLVDDGATTWITVEPGGSPALVAWLERMRFMLRVEVADVTDRYAVARRTHRRESAAAGSRSRGWTRGQESSTRCRSGGRGHRGIRAGGRAPRAGATRGASDRAAGGPRAAMSGTGRWPGSGRPRRCGSWRGGRGWGRDRSPHHRRTRSTGCARRCTCTRAATAGRRRSPACTTSAIRRGGWCSCTWTGRGTCSRGRRGAAPVGRTLAPRRAPGPVGFVTTVAPALRDGPIALALVKRSLPVEAALVVADLLGGPGIAATQTVVVAP
jgi:hypothetical protein